VTAWLGDRAHVRDVFLRLLGVIFLVAFLSLLVQLQLLYGSTGLLPAHAYLARVRDGRGLFELPTIFLLADSDAALHAAAVIGAVLAAGLIFNLAPRYCLLGAWVLYLSFATIGQDFMSFQWDNLLLEAGLFSLFVTPAGLRPRHPPPPHPLATFLMLWLVFRLHFESGAAKLLSGDPTWRDLTAMASYYETAPIPTWVAWYAHQWPAWVHRATSLLTLVIELGLAPLVWAAHRVRTVVFLVMVAIQLVIVLTANYGFFNYLSIVLCLWVLDDSHLVWLAGRCGWTLPATPHRQSTTVGTVVMALAAAVLLSLSVVPFLRFTPWAGALPGLTRILDTYRSINAYHLFASMTLVRLEAVIEGSNDGEHWEAYELCYKPGEVTRPPRFVAPYQPRVDFQLWFLLLGRRGGALYFDNLLRRLLTEPRTVASLFCHDPFGGVPPRLLRVAVYEYRFTAAAARRRTGAWWQRELRGYSQTLTNELSER
jgi:hypothetical protein